MSGYFDRLLKIQQDAGQTQALNSAVRTPMNMNQGAAQARLYGGLQTGDYGQLASRVLGASAAADHEKQYAQAIGAYQAEHGGSAEAAQSEVQKQFLEKRAGMTDLDKVWDVTKSSLADAGAQYIGTGLSAAAGFLPGNQTDQAMMRAGTAGAFADARNAHARNALLAGAQSEAENMNLAARAQAAGMADSAIAQANAYDMGMQGIAMNGIEGSANMERNLLYGQDRADAEEQLAFDIQGKQAADLEASMVNSFEQLSRGKQQAVSGAWGDALGSMQNQLTQSRMNTSNAAFQMQAGRDDWDAALGAAEAVPAEAVYREETAGGEAAQGSPQGWQVPGAPGPAQPGAPEPLPGQGGRLMPGTGPGTGPEIRTSLTSAPSADPNSAAAMNAIAASGVSPTAGAGYTPPVQGTLDFDQRQTQAAVRKAQQSGQMAAPPAAPPPAQASGKDLYADLEAYLRTRRSRGDLDREMNRLGISDPDLKARIQQGVMSGDANWRKNLREILGAG